MADRSSSVRFEMRLPRELAEAVDAARAPGQSRADWIKRAVERALGAGNAPERGRPAPEMAPARKPPVPRFARVQSLGGGKGPPVPRRS